MSSTQKVNIEDVRSKLNELLLADTYGITNLAELRILVNYQITKVENLEVSRTAYDTPQLGLLEILNYLFGETLDPLVAIKNNDGEIMEFVRSSSIVDPTTLDAAMRPLTESQPEKVALG